MYIATNPVWERGEGCGEGGMWREEGGCGKGEDVGREGCRGRDVEGGMWREGCGGRRGRINRGKIFCVKVTRVSFVRYTHKSHNGLLSC